MELNGMLVYVGGVQTEGHWPATFTYSASLDQKDDQNIQSSLTTYTKAY
jgi:hypothetical protein